ncbi:MAG: MarR family transcriptional regulator [Chloroflexaceae bacterium]|nr:MarR family transcriptional regulator [Chloroflexaceae bacterium]NJL34117.1 MarR family transcriptional regulator [Chloroflexaceae bacterium]NJO04220.1 MarR family transcriptional regulator [Chloroflexaceae bacterium]
MDDSRTRGYMLGALLRIPFEAMALHINEALQKAGFEDIRPAHQRVFQHLPPEGARVTDLAEAAQMTKQSMGTLITHLEEGGYVERHRDPQDGRAQIIHYTARGREVERVARTSIAEIEAVWAQRLGHAEFAHLHKLLWQLVALLEEEPEREGR